MKKTYIIIHTHTSIDGNINSMDLPEFDIASQHYQQLCLSKDSKIKIDAYLNGKTSTEDNVTFYKKPKLDENAPKVPGGDYVAVEKMPMYYISIDPKGELAFETNTFYYGGVPTHFIEVLTEKASNAYKAFLRSKEISYIVAGQNNIDFEIMFEKLQELFGIRRLMVGGGGTINWTFLDRGFVDEVSMIIAPIANGDPNASRFFTAKEPYTKIKDKAFELKNVEVLDGGVIWALYKTKK